MDIVSPLPATHSPHSFYLPTLFSLHPFTGSPRLRKSIWALSSQLEGVYTKVQGCPLPSRKMTQNLNPQVLRRSQIQTSKPRIHI